MLTLVGGDVGWVERYAYDGSNSSSVSPSSEGSIGGSPSIDGSISIEGSSSSDERLLGKVRSEVCTTREGETEGKDGRGRQGWEGKHAKLVTIEGAGHDLTGSHPALVVKLLDEFFAD